MTTAVRLVAGARHRHIGQRPAVGRHRGQVVGRIIGVGQVDRRRRSVGRRRENVEIGRESARSAPPRAARNIRSAVGRESDLLPAAERLGRRIADQPAGQRNATAASLPPTTGKAKQARPLARVRPTYPNGGRTAGRRCGPFPSPSWPASRRNRGRRSAGRGRPRRQLRSPDRRNLEPADVAGEVADLHRRRRRSPCGTAGRARRPASGTTWLPSGPNTASCPFSAPATGCGAAPGLVRSSR